MYKRQVERVHDKFDTLNICTVVGFPLGYSVTAAKLAEVEKALKDGANEIDMVVNISDVKNHQYGKVEAEIRALKEACGGHVLKVIICLLYTSCIYRALFLWKNILYALPNWR